MSRSNNVICKRDAATIKSYLKQADDKVSVRNIHRNPRNESGKSSDFSVLGERIGVIHYTVPEEIETIPLIGIVVLDLLTFEVGRTLVEWVICKMIRFRPSRLAPAQKPRVKYVVGYAVFRIKTKGELPFRNHIQTVGILPLLSAFHVIRDSFLQEMGFLSSLQGPVIPLLVLRPIIRYDPNQKVMKSR